MHIKLFLFESDVAKCNLRSKKLRSARMNCRKICLCSAVRVSVMHRLYPSASNSMCMTDTLESSVMIVHFESKTT